MKSSTTDLKDVPTTQALKTKEAGGIPAEKNDATLSDDNWVPEHPKRSLSRAKSGSVSISSVGTIVGWQPGQKFTDKSRPKWSNGYDSIIVPIATAVGISNISRFPIVVYRNGGTAFLIPYILFLIFGAFPIMYQQRILGQFVQQGCVGVWKIVPIFKGIGYAIQLISIFFVCYYSVTLAWTMLAVFESLNSTLSSTICGNAWNTASCIIPTFASYNTKVNITNQASAGREYFRGRILRLWPSDYSDGDSVDEVLLNTENDSLNRTTFGFHSKMGRPNLDLCICMFFIFSLYFLALLLGIKMIQKIAWISAISVFVILPILLVRGLTLDGAWDALVDIAKPKFKALLLPATWARAGMLAISSTSVGYSVQMNLASLNYFKNDTFRDSLITCVIDTLTNLFTTMVMFCWIGNSAYVQNVAVSQVVGNVTEGSGLIFELFTDVAWSLSGARFFILIFYIMIFLLGLSSVIPTFLSIMMGFMDEFTKWFPPQTNSEQILNFTLTSWAYVASLTCCARGGIWMFKFMGIYATSVSLILCLAMQMIVVSWIWGLEDLCSAADAMMGRMPGVYLRLCWKFVTPIILLLVAVFGWMDLTRSRIEYNGGTAPPIVKTAGAWVTFIPLALIPIFVIYQLIHFPADNFKLKIRFLFHPENEHHDIRKGRISSERFTFSHIFFLGLSDACRKKTKISSKPKIHPSKVIKSSSRESKPFNFTEDDEETGVDLNGDEETHGKDGEIPLTNMKSKKSRDSSQPELEPQSKLSEEKENSNDTSGTDGQDKKIKHKKNIKR